MASLYEINQQFLNAIGVAKVEAFENDGEIEETTADELDRLEMARDQKIENTALYIKNKVAEVAMIKAEEKKQAKITQQTMAWIQERIAAGAYPEQDDFNKKVMELHAVHGVELPE